MTNIIVAILGALLFSPVGLAADTSLSFTPPITDVSVVFLGNIFGIVDGVLHGTGSQILGNMFGVFNAAVLALGGIIIIYTLMVSTVNTAHEGQMLGQKWSSMWVPMRATLGLALLIPKASGYCLMQIFIMWVVIQGVGAADRVWEAALSYLKQGGVIVQAQQNPIATYLVGGNTDIPQGASTILSGQVCMVGLQTILTNTRQGYLNRASKQSGPCSGTPTPDMAHFCSTPVPDFLETVNVVTIQQNTTVTPYKALMPNFDKNSLYEPLNGICGTISWQPYTEVSSLVNKDGQTVAGVSSINGITPADVQTAQMSRAVAIQQMYTDLSTIAQLMINNDPAFMPIDSSNSSTSVNEQSKADYPGLAQQQFGIPYNAAGSPCTTLSPPKGRAYNKNSPPPDNQDMASQCTNWGSDSTSKHAPLFSGTEFVGAQADYNGIMLPTLTLVAQAQAQSATDQQASQNRAFINTAANQGWLLAGSYFINLAKINAANSNSALPEGSAPLTDNTSGLNVSFFDIDKLLKSFPASNNQECGPLCTWLSQDSTSIKQLIGLINGTGLMPTPVSPPVFKNTSYTSISGIGASTTFGYINNAQMVSLPGQPGMTAPQFSMKINFGPTPTPFSLPQVKFSCGKIHILTFSFCLTTLLGELFYNTIIVTIFNVFIDIMTQVISNFVIAILSIPLLGMAQIFTYGVSFIQQPGVNPVIALANMGVNYINFANDLWIYIFELAIIPGVNLILIPIIALMMPLLLAWVGAMVSIGFITAYYIPFLPYMIFTFGSIAWLMAVIEAMVAAPIIALGITHPEGEGPFGKGEQAIMILMNIFLRPAMMIIGYIAGIVLSYVAVWVINAGFANVVGFIQGDPNTTFSGSGAHDFFFNNLKANVGVDPSSGDIFNITNQPGVTAKQAGAIGVNGYTGWAGIYGFFFSILIYTTMYLVAVQKAFTLITLLPDKVLRWIGGQPESIGSEASQWGEESKRQVESSGKDTQSASGQMDQQLTGLGNKAINYVQGGGGSVDATGNDKS